MPQAEPVVIRLIINADDFGMTEGVCRGIVEAIRTGVVTATTAMVCVPGAQEHLRKWAPLVAGYVGAHLQLTSGAPVLPAELVPSLVGDDGKFPARRKMICNPRAEEILAEWQAQLECLLRAGVSPTHMDTHHHVHGLPDVFPAFCELAKRYSLPARALHRDMTYGLRAAGVACIGQTLTAWYGGELSVRTLLQVLEEGTHECPEAENFELMCHPGLADKSLSLLSRYVDGREVELATLCKANLQQELAEAGFCLSHILPSSIPANREVHT
jgi:predicted glycoside hydrolase/deacetylase ChbG (UPF0249 family)